MIEEHKFGSFLINGRRFYGDLKIIDSQVKYWSAREKHLLAVKDVKDIVDSQPQMIVVGKGNSGYLEISQEVKNLCSQNRIALSTGTNTEAIKKYNQALTENKKVAAIFHATC